MYDILLCTNYFFFGHFFLWVFSMRTFSPTTIYTILSEKNRHHDTSSSPSVILICYTFSLSAPTWRHCFRDARIVCAQIVRGRASPYATQVPTTSLRIEIRNVLLEHPVRIDLSPPPAISCRIHIGLSPSSATDCSYSWHVLDQTIRDTVTVELSIDLPRSGNFRKTNNDSCGRCDNGT